MHFFFFYFHASQFALKGNSAKFATPETEYMVFFFSYRRCEWMHLAWIASGIEMGIKGQKNSYCPLKNRTKQPYHKVMADSIDNSI